MNNNEYIKSVEEKIDKLNENSLKSKSLMPFSINRHLNGLYNLSYGMDVIAWMLKPRELWQLVNSLCILNILGGLKNDNMEAWKRNKLKDSYIYYDGKIEKMSIEKAAPKKKRKPLTDQQKLNEMLEAFPF